MPTTLSAFLALSGNFKYFLIPTLLATGALRITLGAILLGLVGLILIDITTSLLGLN